MAGRNVVGFGMAEIVPFPERKPVEGTLQTVSLDELLSVLAGRTTVEDIAWERRYREIMATLNAMDVPTLRRLWDGVGDDSFYDGPEGSFDCADIHLALNLKGDGAYCAV